MGLSSQIFWPISASASSGCPEWRQTKRKFGGFYAQYLTRGAIQYLMMCLDSAQLPNFPRTP